MIGNDIVDRAYAAQTSDWKRPGYLQKLFSPKEIALIYAAVSKEEMVWRLWTMKESVYKAAFRNVPIRAFNPRKFDCSIHDEVGGEVTYTQEVYVTKSTLRADLIHTIAWLKGQEMLKLNDFHNDFGARVSSADLYQFLLKNVAERLNCAINELEVKKNDARIPEIFRIDQKLDVLISISHHGTFGGVVIYT